MTVTANIQRADYNCNGATTVFAVPFQFFGNQELQVLKTDTTVSPAVVTQLNLTTDYTVTGGADATGSITTVATFPTGIKLSILMNGTFQQNSHYVPNDPFPAVTHEQALDRLTLQDQQILEKLGRAAVLPPTVAGVNPALPVPLANAAIMWDATGTNLVNGTSGSTAFSSATPVMDGVGNAGVAATVSHGDHQHPTDTSRAPNAFTQVGTGAIVSNVNTKLLQLAVTPLDYGAVGNGIADDSAAIQAAINTGLTVDLVGKTYKAHGLTMSAAGQAFISSVGIATVIKNANGPIITFSGSGNQVINVGFRGDASTPTFTGDNVDSSGSNFSMVNCGSRWAYARAIKSTGGHTQIIGTCDIYQTADTTSAGYDIELGVSGTSTLYHQLHGIYSSQSTGGILMTDTGSTVIAGGQFGKLTIASGTSPSGVNGGMTIGARILGNISVSLSNATFTGNQIDAVSVTFQAGTSQCSMNTSNVFAVGATVTNLGNTNNYIAREVSGGSNSQYKIGPDPSLAIMTATPSTGVFNFPSLTVTSGFTLLGGVASLPVGGAGTPSLNWGDGGTGLYRPSLNALGFASNGNSVGNYTSNSWTFNVATMTLGGSAIAGTTLNMAASGNVFLNFQPAGAQTMWSWLMGSSAAQLGAYNGSGGFIDNPISISNLSGGAITLGGSTARAVVTTGYFGQPVGGAVASASTITLTGPVTPISGSTTINTVNLPYAGFTGTVALIPTGAWSTGTSGNIAKAIQANVGQTIQATFDGTKWQFSYLSPAFGSAVAAAPASTTSTTNVMMGLALTVTPTRSGVLIISGSGQMANNTVNDGATVQLYYGTGAAPTNGAAVTGTAIGTSQTHTSLVAADTGGWSFVVPVPNLTVGTTYWIDVALKAVTGGTASIAGVTVAAVEL